MPTTKYAATFLDNLFATLPALIVNRDSSDLMFFVHVIKTGDNIFDEHFQAYVIGFRPFGEVIQRLGEAIEDKTFVQ